MKKETAFSNLKYVLLLGFLSFVLAGCTLGLALNDQDLDALSDFALDNRIKNRLYIEKLTEYEQLSSAPFGAAIFSFMSEDEINKTIQNQVDNDFEERIWMVILTKTAYL